LNRAEGEDGPLKKGDYVVHDRYGVGRVLRAEGETVTVLFAVGKKTFMKDKAKLRKL